MSRVFKNTAFNLQLISSFKGEYSFLSNMHNDCKINIAGNVYTSSEHIYQAAKFSDKKDSAKVLSAKNGYEAKRFANEIPFYRKFWMTLKNMYMLAAVLIKFNEVNICQQLLNTGNAKLVEGNTHGDIYWGTVHGYGDNYLGKILMLVREYYMERAKNNISLIEHENIIQSATNIFSVTFEGGDPDFLDFYDKLSKCLLVEAHAELFKLITRSRDYINFAQNGILAFHNTDCECL